MLKKKENLYVLKVIKNLPSLLNDIDYTKTTISGRGFSILKKHCSIWKWDKNYVSVCIGGGMNGRGNWSDYLKTIQEAMIRIENTWEDAFIENIENDIADDIFYVTIIIKVK